MRAIFQWHVGSRVLELGRRTLIMGVVNVTPDSFSDGGKYIDAAKAVAHGERLFDEGATIIDVGGESTRPGSEVVSEDEERRRVLPVIRDLKQGGAAAGGGGDQRRYLQGRRGAGGGGNWRGGGERRQRISLGRKNGEDTG